MIDPSRFTSAAPAHRFPADSHPFRVRVSKGKADAAPPNVASLGRAVRAMSSKKGVSGARRGAGSLRDGRGVTSGAQRSGMRQRVIVKARVVVNGPRVKARRGITAHVGYLERDEVSVDGKAGQAFDRDGDLDHDDVVAFVDRAVDDRHHFRFIVSPERGADLDLEEYARDFMRQTEADLGTRLDWLGAVHTNTDNPHVHLVVRGVDERGADLVMSRDYISHGLRESAQDIATRYLGPRLEADIEKERAANISAERFTALDRRLVNIAQDGIVSTRVPEGAESERAYKARLTDIGRLQHLEGLGMAEEIAPGQWQLGDGFETRLRDMGTRHDIVKQVHARLGPKDRPSDIVLYSKDAPPGVKIAGEVIDHGMVDEITDRQYLVVNGADGKAYYVALSRFSERPEANARIGSVVTLETVQRPATTNADQNITEHAARHGGVYDAQAHRDEVVRSGRLPTGADPEEYVAAHVRRLEGHARRRLVDQVDGGRFKVPADLTDRLQEAAGKGRDSGAYVEVVRQSPLGLREQMSATGPTWLDSKIAAGEHLQPVNRIGASRFQMRVRAALRGRVAQLRARGLMQEQDGQASLRLQALDEMYRQEHAQKAAQLSRQLGQHVSLKENEPFRGKVARVEQLASGPHAVVVGEGNFALVPMRGGLARQVGQRVELTVQRSRPTMDRGQPSQMQMPMRYVALDVPTRQRGGPARGR